jgi:hypothetical protein
MTIIVKLHSNLQQLVDSFGPQQREDWYDFVAELKSFGGNIPEELKQSHPNGKDYFFMCYPGGGLATIYQKPDTLNGYFSRTRKYIVTQIIFPGRHD